MLISIIDDEKLLVKKISKKLKLSGFTIHPFYSYQEFLFHGYQDDIYDIYIIDISLWDGSGYDIVKLLRKKKKILKPIIMISWFWDIDNKLSWFKQWVDDYITKPFSPDELLARVKAILRRSWNICETKEVINHKNFTFDIIKNELFKDGIIVPLNTKEKLIISFLFHNIGKLISKDKFIKMFWGYQWYLDVKNNTINVTLSKLRKKLWNECSLETIPHVWYILK